MDRDIEFVLERNIAGAEKRGRRLLHRELRSRYYARYAVDFAYERLSYILTRRRRRTNEMFLSTIVYVFTDWAKLSVPVRGGETVSIDQSTLKLKFGSSAARIDITLQLEDIPVVDVVTSATAKIENSKYIRIVRGLLSRLYVDIEYDAAVRSHSENVTKLVNR